MKKGCAVRAVYPDSHSSSLLDYLTVVVPSVAITLVQDKDPHEFRKLLEDTQIVSDAMPTAQSFNFPPSSPSSSVREILNRSVPLLLRSHASGREQNCLTFGYKQKTGNTDAVMRNHLNTECYFVNTIQTLLVSAHWQLLVDRIGEDAFRHLLTKKMFVKTYNGSYLQISGSTVVESSNNPTLHSWLNRSMVVRGSTVISRYRMLYNTRREGKAGLPKSFCFFKKSTEQIIGDIFGEHLANPSVQDSLRPLLVPWIEQAIRRYCEYDMKSAMKKFCSVGAAEKLPTIAPAVGTGGKRKRGCRAGKHAKEHQKQSAMMASTLQSASSILVSNPAPVPLTTLGDRILENMLGNTSADISLLPNGFSTQEQSASQDFRVFGSSIVGSGGRSSKSQRKRMKRKLKSMLCETGHKDPVEDTLQADMNVMPVISLPSGLKHHLSRPFFTFVADEDESKAKKPRREEIKRTCTGEKEVWEKATHIEGVKDFVKSVCKHVFNQQDVWGSKHNHHVFMQNIDIYLSQARHETLTIACLTNGLSTNAMPLFGAWKAHLRSIGMANLEEHFSQHVITVLQCLLYFIFNDFMNSLVGNTFYVTEVEGTGQGGLYYFRKPTWFNIVRDHMEGFKSQFVPICISGNGGAVSRVQATSKTMVDSPQRANSLDSSVRGVNSSHCSTALSPAMPSTAEPASLLFNSLLPSQRAGSAGNFARTSSLPSTSHARMPLRVSSPSDGLNRTYSVPSKSTNFPSVRPAAPRLNVPVVRFVPKKTTVRPIANMRSKGFNNSSYAWFTPSSIPGGDPVMSKVDIVTNSNLQSCKTVLQAIYDQNPDLGGCGVFGADDIYRRLRTYKQQVEEKFGPPSADEEGPRFYMAMLDVEKCYDNVKTNTVFDIVEHLVNCYTRPYPANHAGGDSVGVYDGVSALNRVSSVGNNSSTSLEIATQTSQAPGTSSNIIIHKYQVTHAQANSTSLQSSSAKSSGSFSKPVVYVSLTGDLVSFPEAGPVLAQQYPQSIIADSVAYNQANSQELLKQMACHLFKHVVRMPVPFKQGKVTKSAITGDTNCAKSGGNRAGSSYFNQIKGIPQGSKVSALLCTLYYGYIEHQVFDLHRKAPDEPLIPCSQPMHFDPLGLESGETLLLRCMDDYLIISIRPRFVQTFLSTVFTTYRSDYDIHVNMSKVKVNFPVSVVSQQEELHFDPPPASQQSMTWCGWLLDYSNRDLQVKSDFQRIIKMSPCASSVPSVRLLKKSVCNWIRMRCHALILDTASLNTKASVLESIYQVYCVAAFRMGISLDKLTSNSRRVVKMDEQYVMRCIRECILYGARLIHGRRHSRALLQNMPKSRLVHRAMERTLHGDSGREEDHLDKGAKLSKPYPFPTASNKDISMKEALLVGWSAFIRAADNSTKSCVLHKTSMRSWLARQAARQLAQTPLTVEDRAVLQQLQESTFLKGAS